MKRIKKLPGLKGVDLSFTPTSQKGSVYHTLGIYLNFKEKTPQDVREIVLKLREEDPEVWVRGGGTGFGLNCLMLLPGDEKLVVERFQKIFE